MARDRQRAKQRRRRQEGAQRPRAPREERLDELAEDASLEGTTPGSHKDAGLEDVVDEPGPEGTTPAPDPFRHGSAYIDEVKLAEAGAGVPAPDGDALEAGPSAPGLDGDLDVDVAPSFEDLDDYDDMERSPDEAEQYAAPVRGRRGAPARERHEHAERHHERAKPIAFLGHCVDELKRVQWPDRAHTFHGTAVTLGFVVLAGGYLGLMDAIWKPIIEAIL
jgi:preprotein translocase SecE subunit